MIPLYEAQKQEKRIYGTGSSDSQQLKAFHLSRLLSWRLFGARKSQVVPCADVYYNAVNILWQSFSSASHLDRTHGEGRREEKCFAQ